MTFLTGLIAKIIGPIIQEQLDVLFGKIQRLYHQNKKYEKIDRETELYLPKLAAATTSEERWALLEELDERRNGIYNSLDD